MSRRNTTTQMEIDAFENQMVNQFPVIFDILIRIERQLHRGVSNDQIIRNVRQNLSITGRIAQTDLITAQENTLTRILYAEAVRAMGLLFENTHPALEVNSHNVRDQANINMICELNNWILNNRPPPLVVGDNDYSDDSDDEDDINASHGGRKRKSRKSRKTRKSRKLRKSRK